MAKPTSRDGAPKGIFAAGIQVFRFYPDGVLLDVLVRPAPGPQHGARIERWLRRESPPAGVYSVRYDLHAGKLTFHTPSHLREGETIAWQGTWRRRSLTLARPGHEPDVFPALWPAAVRDA